MPELKRDEALRSLTSEVERFGADELLEVYNEVFPDDPYTAEEAADDVTPLVEQLVDHVNGDREIEEIVDLWGLVFTGHRNVWYDDEAERLHYEEETEPVPST